MLSDEEQNYGLSSTLTCNAVLIGLQIVHIELLGKATHFQRPERLIERVLLEGFRAYVDALLVLFHPKVAECLEKRVHRARH